MALKTCESPCGQKEEDSLSEYKRTYKSNQCTV